MRRLASIGVLVVLLLIGVAISPASVLANMYSGNTRSLGAGIKASIATPSDTPDCALAHFIASWVSNADVGDGGLDWVQVGWTQGILPDGEGDPLTDPHSYREAKIDAFYDWDTYSQQALNFARAYEVVDVGWDSMTSSYGWRTYVAGQQRGDYYGFAEKSEVQALSENSHTTDVNSASFSSVSKRELFVHELRPGQPILGSAFTALTGSSNYYTYTTHANGL